MRNLVRAVTRPYPGAFSHIGNRKCLFWSVRENRAKTAAARARCFLSHPLSSPAARGRWRCCRARANDGITQSGPQLAEELGLVEGMRFGPAPDIQIQKARKKSVLILGVNGFIGNHLSERLLESGRYEVHGMDLNAGSLQRLMDHPDFYFSEGDISIHREWIEYHVRKCDIVLPLVAIATPIEYVRNPLRVFELDFEENLRVVRYCAKYGKRILFPSTSEVYGMCGTTTSTKTIPAWCWGRSTSSAGSTRAASSCWTGSSGPTAPPRAFSSPCSGLSTGSVPGWTAWSRPASAAPGPSRS